MFLEFTFFKCLPSTAVHSWHTKHGLHTFMQSSYTLHHPMHRTYALCPSWDLRHTHPSKWYGPENKQNLFFLEAFGACLQALSYVRSATLQSLHISSCHCFFNPWMSRYIKCPGEWMLTLYLVFCPHGWLLWHDEKAFFPILVWLGEVSSTSASANTSLPPRLQGSSGPYGSHPC